MSGDMRAYAAMGTPVNWPPARRSGSLRIPSLLVACAVKRDYQCAEAPPRLIGSFGTEVTTSHNRKNANPRGLIAKQLLPYRFAWPQTDAAAIHEHNRSAKQTSSSGVRRIYRPSRRPRWQTRKTANPNDATSYAPLGEVRN
jgi:hypothetical protein